MTEVPTLLVAWEGRWHGFVSSLPVVFSRSPGGERGFHVASGIPLRRPLVSFLGHCALVFAWLWLSPWFFLLFPSGIPVAPVRMVVAGTVYYFPQALPETGDVGGARAGIEGRPGGKHAYHPLQTIRIARGPKPVDTIVDAPRLALPRTRERVANLLAFSGAAPSPPVNAVSRPLRQLAALSYAPAPVAPAPQTALSTALRTPPAMAAIQFQPAPPPPIPQAEMRSSLNSARTADVAVGAPALSAVILAPKLILPAAGSVPPVAPRLRRAISDAAGSLAAGVSANVAPPSPEGAAGPAGSTSGGGREGTAESQAAFSSQGGAAGNGGAAAGDGVGAGGGDAQGLIVSLNPGDKLGIPPGGADGSLAMSPAGSDAGGLGGSGTGGSIGHGPGPGSGAAGAGPGSGSTGGGAGAANAAAGISPSPGVGGAGQASGKLALLPGVTIQGGVITLPSFGSDAALPSAAAIAPLGPRRAPAVVVIATSRSGGGLNSYGALRGSRVYTTYIDTPIGTAVLQYSDPASRPGFESDLTPPEPLQTQLPAEVKSLHMVVKFVMDKVGNLRELRLLESEDPASAALLMTALQRWQFRPALKANVAIDVEAILGFMTNTQ
jgi:hypothetical protein